MVFSLFKKKSKEKQTFKDLIIEWESAPLRNLRFTAEDMRKFMSRVKSFRNMRLYPFSSFIEKLDIIITNNQFKSGYTMQKALNELDKWNYPVYKKIAFIDNINIINRFLTPEYITYNYLFEKTDLKKILHNVAIARETHKVKSQYAQTVRKALTWFNGLTSTVNQFVVIIALSQLIVFPLLLAELQDLKKVKLVWQLNPVDQIWLNLFSWLVYFGDSYSSAMGYIWLFFLVTFTIFCSNIVSSLTKVYFLNQANNNKRIVDQSSNEIAFASIVLKNIKMLEIWEDSWKYQYVNFSEFMLKSSIEALSRWLVNEKFVTEFSYIFQFYYQFGEMPKGKVFAISDWFKNVIEDVLISYKTSLSGAGNFSLSLVYRKFDHFINTIGLKMFNKAYQKLTSTFVTIVMVAMAIWVVVNMLVSIMQNDGMKTLMSTT